MRSTQFSVALSPFIASVLVLAMILAAPPPALAKRFDCQMFCRTTGFSGMVGGCRCSFTLFTAKRSTRDHNSVPEEAPSYVEEQQYPRMQDFSLVDLLRMARETNEAQSAEEEEQHLEGGSRQGLSVMQAIPKSHPVRLLVKPTAGSSSNKPRSNRLSRSPSQLVVKRREFEQDLDNGDTSDYLRLPY